MSRYTGPKCKLCRQLGFSVCGSLKCALLRRESPPGMHGRFPSRRSDFGRQLLEKQKLRHTYWVSEKQFRNYASKAFRRKGESGENLLRLLEMRLDNVVYRLGFAPTIPAARQIIVHGHILVNGSRIDRPSYSVEKGDMISVGENSKKMMVVQEGLVRAMARAPLSYVQVDKENLRGTFVEIPKREQIPIPIDESRVVEYYSRMM